MSVISLDDVKGAISIAWNMWGKREAKTFLYKLESGKSINIIGEQKGGMLNYGIPNIYPMDKSSIPALKTWWEDNESKRYGKKGVLKDRQPKSQRVFAVNAFYHNGMPFNFHVPTT